MSVFVIEFIEIINALNISSTLLAFRLLSVDFILDQASSIGFKSGEYGGKNNTIAPFSYIGFNISLTLCTEQLSITTISPAFKVGARKYLIYGPKTSWFNVPLNVIGAFIPSSHNVAIIEVLSKRTSGT